MSQNNEAGPTGRSLSERDNPGCNLCGSVRSRTAYIKFDLSLIKCRRCGLIYTWPRPTEEEIQKRYSRDYFYKEYLPVFGADETSFDPDLARNHYDLTLNLLDRFSPGREAGKLLDIGCGGGLFLKAAGDMGWDVEGVEISPTAARYANTVVGVPVRRARFEETGFPPEDFDAVTLLDTVEHLQDPVNILREVRRVLKKDGILIVTTPDVNSLSRTMAGEAWAVLSPAEHLYNFSKKTLGKLMAVSGFSPLMIKNQVNINPEYVHGVTRRTEFWKRTYKRIENKRFYRIIREENTRDILEKKEECENIKGRIKSVIRWIFYRVAHHGIKGDNLIVIARKG